MCAVFVAFWLEKHNFFEFFLVFVSEFEALFAWLPYINDLLKAFPLGKHYLWVAFSEIHAQKFSALDHFHQEFYIFVYRKYDIFS